LDNYNSIYNYGFWIVIEVNKVLKFPVFLGNEVLTNEVDVVILYFII